MTSALLSPSFSLGWMSRRAISFARQKKEITVVARAGRASTKRENERREPEEEKHVVASVIPSGAYPPRRVSSEYPSEFHSRQPASFHERSKPRERKKGVVKFGLPMPPGGTSPDPRFDN